MAKKKATKKIPLTEQMHSFKVDWEAHALKLSEQVKSWAKSADNCMLNGTYKGIYGETYEFPGITGSISFEGVKTPMPQEWLIEQPEYYVVTQGTLEGGPDKFVLLKWMFNHSVGKVQVCDTLLEAEDLIPVGWNLTYAIDWGVEGITAKAYLPSMVAERSLHTVAKVGPKSDPS